MAAKKEIIFFILIKLSIKHHNFKIFLAQSKYVHCKGHGLRLYRLSLYGSETGGGGVQRNYILLLES